MPSCQCDLQRPRACCRAPAPASSSAIPGRCGGCREPAAPADADHEHAAPADVLEQQSIDDRGEEIAGRVTRLQEPGHEAARLRRYRFHGQRRADAPFAAHRDAEYRAQDQERRQARREAGGTAQSPNRTTRRPSESDAGPSGRRRGRTGRRRPAASPMSTRMATVTWVTSRAEFLRDVLEHEHHEEEIEGVERPAEKARCDDVLLLAGPARKRFDAHGSNSQVRLGSALDVGVGPIVAAR